jgi:hypothetical protein
VCRSAKIEGVAEAVETRVKDGVAWRIGNLKFDGLTVRILPVAVP